MIKAAFVKNGNDGWIDKVYDRDSINTINQYASIYPEPITRENIEDHTEYLRDVEVIFTTWGMPCFSEVEITYHFPKLRALFYAAGSVQSFARPFLNKGVTVVSAWAANAVPVAEYTLAQILLANKGYFQNALKAKKSYDAARRYSETFFGNYGARIGILGAGMIGSIVIELLKPFNLEILVYDPFLSDERAEKLGVRKCTLKEIFSECQTISNHIANLPTTQKMLNREHFEMMLPNATFINTGRGAQLVEDDLIQALKAVPTRTALLDVTDPEPPLPSSNLFQMENVFLTTHIAGSMGEEVKRMGRYMADEFVNYINGKELKYGVTLKMLETMA